MDSTSTLNVPVSADAVSVTESVFFTLDDVIASFTHADNAEMTLAQALIASRAAFITSAMVTFSATKGGVTAKAIAAAARTAGVGYQSVSAVLRHARTGEILNLGGELADDFDPRSIQLCYDKTTKVRGERVVISVTAKQHAAIVASAVDVADGYRLLVKANRDNLAALKAVADASAAATADAAADDVADGGSDDVADDVAYRRLSVSESLAIALATLTSIIGQAFTEDNYAAAGAVLDALTAAVDTATELAA